MIEPAIKKALQLRKIGAWRESRELFETHLDTIKQSPKLARTYAYVRQLDEPLTELSGQAIGSLEEQVAGAPNHLSGWGIFTGFHLVGWLPDDVGPGKAIKIYLNGATIAVTATSSEPLTWCGVRLLQFNRFLSRLEGFLGHGDEICVSLDGRIVPTCNGEISLRVEANRPSVSGSLLAALSTGYVFNKYGKMQQRRDEDGNWLREMTALFNRLQVDISEQLGLQLFAFYGTMLRGVRDGKIAPNTNDLDFVYFSHFLDAKSIRREFVNLCLFLKSRGYLLRVRKSHVHVKIRGVGKLDIFFAWFDESGTMGVSYGTHGKDFIYSPGCLKARSVVLGGADITVPVPEAAEEMLESLYGCGWRYPNPGFSHKSNSRKVKREFLLTDDELSLVRSG